VREGQVEFAHVGYVDTRVPGLGSPAAVGLVPGAVQRLRAIARDRCRAARFGADLPVDYAARRAVAAEPAADLADGMPGPQGVEELASSRLTRALVAAVRVMVALLWIENLYWKRPPEFGNKSNPPEGLYQWTLYGVQNEVFGLWAWFVDTVVLPNFLFFAWTTFVVEACLGAFLLVGLATRFWALVGIAQTMAIIFSILRTPNEWFWAYFLMIAAHVVLFAVAAGRTFGVDGVLRPVWRRRRGGPARLLMVAS
jgi:thiosulfate dehydrogenase [quinone] large subunit